MTYKEKLKQIVDKIEFQAYGAMMKADDSNDPVENFSLYNEVIELIDRYKHDAAKLIANHIIQVDMMEVDE